jgi:hypothetical protein
MGTAREVGLLSAPLTLVRLPISASLRVAEFGLSIAAEAARIGKELLGPDRETSPEFAEYRTQPEYPPGNGAAPDELIPDHVDEDAVLVAETAEEGAEEGVGPELTVEAPWDGYDQMTAADIKDRLAAATAAEAAAVELYEPTRKNRRSVMDAAARGLAR